MAVTLAIAQAHLLCRCAQTGLELIFCVVLQMENGYNALLVALDANQDEELLPPEGYIPAGPITPEGKRYHGPGTSLLFVSA